MKSPKKKPLAAKLRNWRVAIMRSRAKPIGTVQAPDRKAAEAEAVKAFDLSEDQRKRLKDAAGLDAHRAVGIGHAVAVAAGRPPR
jgi:hypothetical protein